MNKNILSLIENPKQIRGVSANIITGASGGYLFNTLFDGHPEVLPVDLFTPPQKPDFYYYYFSNVYLSFMHPFSLAIVSPIFLH